MYRLNHHIQSKALYNGRMFRRHSAFSLFHVLIWEFLTKYDIIIQFFIEIKFLQIVNIKLDLWVKWFSHFQWRYNDWYRPGLNYILWMDVHSDLLLNLGFVCQLSAVKQLTAGDILLFIASFSMAMKSNISSAANCLTTDTNHLI